MIETINVIEALTSLAAITWICKIIYDGGTGGQTATCVAVFALFVDAVADDYGMSFSGYLSYLYNLIS